MNFTRRLPELLELEGDYSFSSGKLPKGQTGDFTFSCRHRDILRCSVSRHFRSCYSPDGMLRLQPKIACARKEVAIIFQRDRSGQFLWRAFVVFREGCLKVGKLYGNQTDPDLNIKLKCYLPNLYFTGLDLTAL